MMTAHAKVPAAMYTLWRWSRWMEMGISRSSCPSRPLGGITVGMDSRTNSSGRKVFAVVSLFERGSKWDVDGRTLASLARVARSAGTVERVFTAPASASMTTGTHTARLDKLQIDEHNVMSADKISSGKSVAVYFYFLGTWLKHLLLGTSDISWAGTVATGRRGEEFSDHLRGPWARGTFLAAERLRAFVHVERGDDPVISTRRLGPITGHFSSAVETR